jgi:hypothetical protein
MKCARSKMSYGGTSPTTTDDVVENTRNTSPEKWVATKHRPCFGDDKQTAPARFGDDIGTACVQSQLRQ